MNTDQQIKAHNDKQKKFYNSHTPSYLDFTKNKPYADYLVGKIIPLLNNQSKVLEIGAGQGRFTFSLSEQVKSLHATDVSIHEVSLLRNQVQNLRSKNISTGLLDLLSEKQLTRLPQYDAIVGFFVLHHLPKECLSRVIHSLVKKLNKGGTLAFIEPNNTYPLHAVEMLIMPDMHWEIEKGIYTNYLQVIQQAIKKHTGKTAYAKKFGFSPPFVINSYKHIYHLDKFMESIPLLNNILCPFILVAV